MLIISAVLLGIVVMAMWVNYMAYVTLDSYTDWIGGVIDHDPDMPEEVKQIFGGDAARAVLAISTDMRNELAMYLLMLAIVLLFDIIFVVFILYNIPIDNYMIWIAIVNPAVFIISNMVMKRTRFLKQNLMFVHSLVSKAIVLSSIDKALQEAAETPSDIDADTIDIQIDYNNDNNDEDQK